MDPLFQHASTEGNCWRKPEATELILRHSKKARDQAGSFWKRLTFPWRT